VIDDQIEIIFFVQFETRNASLSTISTRKHCLRSFSLISINTISHQKSSFILVPRISVNPRWTLKGVTVAGSHGDGKHLNQLSFPQGLYADDEQTVFITIFAK